VIDFDRHGRAVLARASAFDYQLLSIGRTSDRLKGFGTLDFGTGLNHDRFAFAHPHHPSPYGLWRRQGNGQWCLRV
jgi:hypothetical protein